jgi:bifunctional NMN adenylyltransferase/nudix hydrolase
MKDISKYSVAVLVGRFQVHELHEAHHYIIKQVVDNHKKIILFLGVSKTAGTKKNPLNFETRKRMIQNKYSEITILALQDTGNDFTWSKEMDKRIREVYPIGEVLMYGGRDSFIPFYKRGGGQFECKELEQHTFVSGTEVRKLVSDQVKESSDFRAGVIYQTYNQFPKVHPNVVIAPFNEDGTKVLLAKRPNENWRFIGGFAHPNDSSYEHTSRRKLIDEAGQIEIGDIQYITSLKVDDWRYRREEDKILTILYKCKYIFGRIEPSQDISELKWIDLNWIRDSWFKLRMNPLAEYDHISGDGMVKEHQELMKIFLKKELE